MKSPIQIISTIKCISCGHKETQKMPEYAAKTIYECSACGTVHRPLENKCCIYCSYGSVLCPPTQRRIGRKTFAETAPPDLSEAAE